MKKLILYISLLFVSLAGFAQRPTLFPILNQSEAASSSTLLNGLVAWWEFDETSGTTAFDETDNNLDGTIGAAVSINQPGDPGQSYYFSGATGSDLVIQDSDLLSFANNVFTFSFCIKPNLSQFCRFISKRSGSIYEYTVGITTDGRIELNMYISGGSSFVRYYSPTASIANNVNQHIVITNESNTNDACDIYVNGVAQTVTRVNSVGSAMANTSVELDIAVNDGVGRGIFNLSQLAIYNRFFSSQGVDSLYNSGNVVTYISLQ